MTPPDFTAAIRLLEGSLRKHLSGRVPWRLAALYDDPRPHRDDVRFLRSLIAAIRVLRQLQAGTHVVVPVDARVFLPLSEGEFRANVDNMLREGGE